MSGTILQTAADLIGSGLPPDELPGLLEDRLDAQNEVALDAIIGGHQEPDPWRLALAVVTGGMSYGEAEELVLRDVDAAIFDAEFDKNQAEVRRLNALREKRLAALLDASRKLDFQLDTTITYAAAAPSEPLAPTHTATHDEATAAVRTAIADAFAGRGPRHVLIAATTGTYKTHTAVEIAASKAAEREVARQKWLEEYYRRNPDISLEEASKAADAAGLRRYRVRYIGETHELVGKTVDLARQKGMSAEHHGGYDRGLDPSDPKARAVCTQPTRRELTQLAGESVPDKACNGCPDLGGCARWQRLEHCAQVNFVGMPTDYATNKYLPRELANGFDVTIIDEALDRAGYGESECALDTMSDRHFAAFPVQGEDNFPDDETTALARAEFKAIRDIFDASPDGYAPWKEVRAAGFDETGLLRLLEWTDRRIVPSGIKPTTPDYLRGELARASFRRQLRALCGLFRALARPEPGWVRLVDKDDGRRVAIVRSVRALHPSILDGPIIALEAEPNLTSWRRFIPDIAVVTAPVPMAPHETAVQIVRPNGKHAMRAPARIAYNKSLIVLYGGHGQDSVLTHLEHEHHFAAPGVNTDHFFALTGSNKHQHCSTMFTFGLPSLSPEAAAHEGAGRTGTLVPIEMPKRALVPALLKNGSPKLVPSMEYADKNAREAQAAVRDRQAIQGPGGRQRAANRTPDNPVTTIFVSRGRIQNKEFDYVITSAEEFAPDRFVRMAANGMVVASGRDRHRLHPDIYSRTHTAEYDAKLEIGGMVATLQRVLFPPWFKHEREPWAVMHYWVKGTGNRTAGRLAACPFRRLPEMKKLLVEKCRAVRIEVTGDLHRPASAEVPMTTTSNDITWVLGTYPRRHVGPLFGEDATPFGAGHPPDG